MLTDDLVLGGGRAALSFNGDASVVEAERPAAAIAAAKLNRFHEGRIIAELGAIHPL